MGGGEDAGVAGRSKGRIVGMEGRSATGRGEAEGRLVKWEEDGERKRQEQGISIQGNRESEQRMEGRLRLDQQIEPIPAVEQQVVVGHGMGLLARYRVALATEFGARPVPGSWAG
jgi:hypothetical protein